MAIFSLLLLLVAVGCFLAAALTSPTDRARMLIAVGLACGALVWLLARVPA